jgi:drug/metabolite transporter (DMT)-like permease
MPAWFLLASVAMVACTAMYLVMRLAQLRGCGPDTYLFGLFALVTVVYAVIAGLDGSGFRISWDAALLTVVVGGGAAWLGNASEQYAIRGAPNPGYPLAINRISSVLTTLIAALTLQARLSVVTVGAVVLVTLGAVIIVAGRGTPSGPGQTPHRTVSWLLWSLTTLVAFTVLTLMAKVIGSRGTPASTYLFYLFLTSSVLFGAAAWRHGGLGSGLRRHLPLIIAMSIASAVLNQALFRAIQLAPNPGYAFAVNSASTALITLLAAGFLGDHLSRRRLAGVLTIVTGVALLAVAGG